MGSNGTAAELSTIQPPQATFFLMEYAQSVWDFSADYVRYLDAPKSVAPFVEGGVCWAHFSGFTTPDINEACFNIGGGADFPLAKQLALRFEVKDFLSPQPEPTVFGADTVRGWTSNLTPMVGLALRFR